MPGAGPVTNKISVFILIVRLYSVIHTHAEKSIPAGRQGHGVDIPRLFLPGAPFTCRGFVSARGILPQ
jgi:hypothetical protein